MADQAILQQLVDREAIRELKARYFRLLDARRWEEFRELFTDDAQFDVQSFPPIAGAEAFVATVRETLEGATTVHHGHMGEITLTGEDDAVGTWVLADYVEWRSSGERRGIQGFGRYEETYSRRDGRWQIASLRLRYTRIDPLPREPLPASVLGGVEPADAAQR